MKYTHYYYLLNVPKCGYIYQTQTYHNLVQIIPNYCLFDYNVDDDIFRYNTVYRRRFKNSVFGKHMIDNHHIIPKEFKSHPLLQELHVDVACSKNIVFLRNRFAKEFTYNNTYIYHDSHRKYNQFVHQELQRIYSVTDQETKKYHFTLFFMYLWKGLTENDPYIKSLFS